ncbi:MAG: hypothetical protein K2M22_11580, partial [Lachnospiraceae bacterium]|nr:hypothetical protein [Lachnospiraceae bacterium]
MTDNTNFTQNTQTYERYSSDGTKKKGEKEKKRNGKFGVFLVLLMAAAIVILANSMVVTKQNQFKLIRQFGRVDRVVSTPGLSFKIPLIESVD